MSKEYRMVNLNVAGNQPETKMVGIGGDDVGNGYSVFTP
jgi:hypothetical protein